MMQDVLLKNRQVNHGTRNESSLRGKAFGRGSCRGVKAARRTACAAQSTQQAGKKKIKELEYATHLNQGVRCVIDRLFKTGCCL